MNIIILLLNCFGFISCTTNSVNKHNLNSNEIENYNLKFILNFTRYLHSIHHFKTFVTFSETRELYANEYIPLHSLEQRLMEEFEIPIVIQSHNNMVQLRHSIGVKTLIFIYISSMNDPIFKVVSYNLRGIHNMPMIFIYKINKNVIPTMEKIQKFFEWCWYENILNVVLTFQVIERKWNYLMNSVVVNIKNEVFKYTPFPEITIYNITDNVYENDGNFIKDYIKDLKGYRFTTPIFMDTPNVFMVS